MKALPLQLKRGFEFVALLALAALAGGCASTGTTGRKEAAQIQMPSAGKARVVFLRPGLLGSALTFSVHDGDRLIGVLPHDAYFVYECEPGRHLFSTSMEDVAMLEADLLPDRVYYAKVSAAMGWFIAQVNMHSLYPGCAGNYWRKLPKVLPSLRETTVTAEMVAKDAQGAANYMHRVEKYYQEKYKTDPKREQILPEHGQTKPVGAL